MELLKANNLTMKFGGITAVKNLNLTLHEGEIISIIGPNGAGKTTAFNMITGVYAPTEGAVIFSGEQINGLKPDSIAKKGISRTFQNIRLFKELSVLDNVLIANHLHIKSSFIGGMLKLPRYRKEEQEMRKRSLELLDKVGLLEYKDSKASSLPYGKQRRLEIARALATKPKILLLDEPAAGMNPTESQELTDFIRDIRNEYNLTILLIEHHMQLVMGISDRIYVLDYGAVIEEGSPSKIQNSKKVIEAYLGVSEDA